MSPPDAPRSGELVYHSLPKWSCIDEGAPGRFKVGAFEIVEQQLDHQERLHHAIAGAKPYVVVVRCLVTSRQELRDREGEFAQLATEIEGGWHYVFGSPYFWETKQYFDPRATRPGWPTNRDAMWNTLPQPKPDVGFTSEAVSPLPWRSWPLALLIECRARLLGADEMLRFLIDLHREALESPRNSVRLVLFGKIADMMRALLPGENDGDRHNRLPERIRRHLRSDVRSLLNQANRYRETRHAAKHAGKLHASMQATDVLDFQTDIDLLARYVVARHTKLPIVQDIRWRLPPTRTTACGVIIIE